MNAYEFAKIGAAIVIEEPNLLPGIFFAQLAAILQKPDVYAKMSAAASTAFMPGGAEKIAEALIALGG